MVAAFCGPPSLPEQLFSFEHYFVFLSRRQAGGCVVAQAATSSPTSLHYFVFLSGGKLVVARWRWLRLLRLRASSTDYVLQPPLSKPSFLCRRQLDKPAFQSYKWGSAAKRRAALREPPRTSTKLLMFLLFFLFPPFFVFLANLEFLHFSTFSPKLWFWRSSRITCSIIESDITLGASTGWSSNTQTGSTHFRKQHLAC